MESQIQLGKANSLILNKTILTHKKLELQTNIHLSITFITLTIVVVSGFFILFIADMLFFKVTMNIYSAVQSWASNIGCIFFATT